MNVRLDERTGIPTVVQDGRWNESQMGNLGSMPFVGLTGGKDHMSHSANKLIAINNFPSDSVTLRAKGKPARTAPRWSFRERKVAKSVI